VFTIEFDPKAEKQLKKLSRHKDLLKAILIAIDQLAQNPRHEGAIKLKGHPFYRVRIGDYRIVYEIQDEKVVIVIITIAHRKDVYRALS
jgi:mRNA interferase RelE/StbE